MTTHMPRRVAVFAAAGASTALLLAGCAGGAESTGSVDLSSDAPTGVTLTMWHSSADSQALLDLYAAYEEASGNTIDFVDLPNDTAPAAVQTKWATGERPDILQYNPSPQDMAQLNMSENMIDISALDYVADSKLSNVAGTIDGVTYGVVLGPVSVYGLYYNKDVLAAAGLDTPPQNAADLLAACSAIQSSGSDASAVFMGGGSEWPSMMLPGFAYMGDANQGNAYGEAVAAGDVKVNDDGSPVETGLQMVVDLREAGCFNDDYSTATYEESLKALLDGTTGMTVLPSDQIAELYAAADAATVDATVGFTSFSAETGVPSYNAGPFGSYFAPKTGDAEKERAAVDFLDWITTEGYQGYVDQAQIVPTISTADAGSLSGLYAEAAELLQRDDATIGFNASIPGFGNFGGIAVKVLVGQSTPSQGVDDWQVFIDQAIAAQQ